MDGFLKGRPDSIMSSIKYSQEDRGTLHAVPFRNIPRTASGGDDRL